MTVITIRLKPVAKAFVLAATSAKDQLLYMESPKRKGKAEKWGKSQKKAWRFTRLEDALKPIPNAKDRNGCIYFVTETAKLG